MRPTEMPGVLLIEPDVHRDGRGFFLDYGIGGKPRLVP